MTSLSDLIARLEAAKEGSRELDALIAVAIFETQKTDDDLIYARKCARSDNCTRGTYWHVQRSGMSLRTAPSYTTSLDAALTLVPKGWFGDVRIGDGAVYAWLRGGNDHPGTGTIPGATSALAICIASLKAREAGR